MFGNLGDMMGMMGKMKEIQAKMKAAQDSLNTISATGESGAGLVRATVNGQKQLIQLDIDPDLVKPDDREMLQDLIVAAINKAMDNIEPKIKAHIQQATEGLLPNIPGMDLGNLMG
ncbi:YbaB/EbfC family nucleoid-associated protein [Fibrella sp. WM1]|uniref:YbaB/EbfC family nucleoid-associated protein n=1 Tax=Fibrella musci TaxID=3242485 RepID=UPI00352085B2